MTARPQRSDAARNSAALLEAARTVFAEDGVDAPAKRITDRAGVGVGTLYRHYPRRSDLIVAVLEQEIEQCIGAAEDLARARPPWDALTSWLQRFTQLVETKQGFAAALHSGDPAYDGLLDRLLEDLIPAADALLQHGVSSGDVRVDVSPREILLTLAGLCHAVRHEPEDARQRMTGIFLDGLRRPPRAS